MKTKSARTDNYMSSASESELHRGRAKQAAGGDLDDVTGQIDAIRADLQNLTSTVGTLAKGQMRRAQDKTLETAAQAEDAIRRNPLQSIGIAAGLGFLFAVLSRR
jgi:ElaB/YqjD/DUF883 family membrane-anchored ribosome-binding protein